MNAFRWSLSNVFHSVTMLILGSLIGGFRWNVARQKLAGPLRYKQDDAADHMRNENGEVAERSQGALRITGMQAA